MGDTQRHPYPEGWEADVVLRDGTTTHLRPIKPADAAALDQFQAQHSTESAYFRFFAPIREPSSSEPTHLTLVDQVNRVALVAVRPAGTPGPIGTASAPEGIGEEIVGVGRYDLVEPGRARVAFNVSDCLHGLGLGSVLLEHLAAAARERGVSQFTADVLPGNAAMLAIFREAGYHLSQAEDDGIVSVSIDLDPTEQTRFVTTHREHRAEARSTQAIMTARRVLLVGPGDHGIEPDDATTQTRDSYGLSREEVASRISAVRVTRRVIATHLVDPGDTDLFVLDAPHSPFAEFAGDPAGARGPQLHSVASWEQLPAVDLLLLATPASRAYQTLERLAATGARGVVVLTSGYGELGEAGRLRQQQLVRLAHSLGMRLVGPGSFGLLTNTPGNRVRASLAPLPPPPGVTGLFCQSAAAAVTLVAALKRRRLGVSSALTAGLVADVSGTDMMQYWLADPHTSVACMYFETIRDPRKFARVAKRLAARKPVVALVAGQGGQVLASGPAGRATGASRATLDDLLRRAGVIRADNIHQLLDIAQVLACQPLPKGRRVGVLATSPSLVALVADAVQAAGLEVANSSTYLALERTPEDVALAVETVFAPESCDAVVVADVPVVQPRGDVVARLVAEAAVRTGLPTVVAMIGLHGLPEELAVRDEADELVAQVPAFATPEDAVAALAKVADYAAWRARGRGALVYPAGADRPGARRIVEETLREQTEAGVVLTPALAQRLLGCYGIKVWPQRPAADVNQAIIDARELGWPVAVKSLVTALRHRTDLGGVQLNLSTEQELRDAVARLRAAAAKVGVDTGFVVQKMAPHGVACVVRSVEDPLFGPLISFGLAGDASALLGDISSAVPPLTDADVRELVREVRAAPRLFGYGGAPPCDLRALEDLVARVSVMADDLPELAALELHPVLVAERGVAVLHATIRLRPAEERDDPLRRVIR